MLFTKLRQKLMSRFNRDLVRELADWTIPDDVMMKIARLPVVRQMEFVSRWRKSQMSSAPFPLQKISRTKRKNLASEAEAEDLRLDLIRKQSQFRERSHPGRDARDKHTSNTRRNRFSHSAH